MVKIYDQLTKYIRIFETDVFGQWISNYGGRRTREDPMQMPFVSYSNAVHEFIEDIYMFMDSHKEYNLKNYEAILNENHIEWGSRSMAEANASKLDDKCIMALLMGLVRADRFSEGIILEFLKKGIVLSWLKRLEEFNQ